MSDIQSIANGTYIIGDTSATNFIAGNGIKIDSPSAGTVRIGNDETVLLTKTITDTLWDEQLSESIYNFERVKFYLARVASGDYGVQQAPVVEEFYTNFTNKKLLFTLDASFTDKQAYRYFTVANINDGTNYKELSACMYNYNNHNLSNWTTANCWVHPYKIVGINRISGGNA